MDNDLWLLFLRLGTVVTIYLFLIQVALVLRRSLSQPDRAARRAGGQAKLVVVESGTPSLSRGQVFAIQGVASIGRTPGNTIKIDDPFVSSEHASVTAGDDQIWIEDRGSRNGTFVNRRQIGKPTPLQPGDVVQIGQVKFKIVR